MRLWKNITKTQKIIQEVGEFDMKIVINKSHSMFIISHKAVLRYAELIGEKLYFEKDEGGDYIYAKVPMHIVKELKSIIPAPLGVIDVLEFKPWLIARNDPALVQVVEELGDAASDTFSKLKIVEIPDDVNWTIKEYDGIEWIAEVHRTWS